MRLKLLLPTVEPDRYVEPTLCPRKGCGGLHFQLRQRWPKPLRDPQLSAVTAQRYGCLRGEHPFRGYPVGVSAAQTSARLRGMAVLLYLLGLSYGAVSLALKAWAIPSVRARSTTRCRRPGSGCRACGGRQ
jgi:hypothetical protein